MPPVDSGAKQYDYIVIGGGSGGSGSARRAAGWYGAKTLIVENGPSGGCCVNVGCVPKKMTWNFASIAEGIEAARHYGYDVAEGAESRFDFGVFKRKREAVIQRLNGAYERNWARDGIELVHGTARFVGPHELEIALQEESGGDGGKVRVTAPHVLIAAGGYPTLPKDIPGAEHGITSDGFFDIEELPPKIAVVGAGYIAVELAGVLQTVGVETHMFMRGETFLRRFDPMVQNTMTKRYEDVGMHLHKNFQGIKKVDKLRDGKGKDKLLKLTMNDGSEMEVNELLWAIGRAPAVEDLGLADIGVKQDPKGYIEADSYQNTSVEGVYAIGDVAGKWELTPGKSSLPYA